MATGGAASGPELRPLDAGEALGAGVSLYTRNAGKLWMLAATVVIPIEILVIIVRRVSLPSGVFLHSGTLYTSTGAQTSAVGVLIALLLHLLATLLVTGAVFHLLLDARLGRSHELSESLAQASHRLGSLLWLGILTALFITVGFILIILPGIYLIVATSVAIPVLMLEGTKGSRAISRSMDLVRGRWWPTLGTFVLAFILYVIAAFVLGAIGAAIAHGSPSVTCPAAAQTVGYTSCQDVTVYEIIIGAVTALGYIVVAPFWAAVVTVIYIDLRVRKEGLDHVTLAGRPREPGATVPPAAADATVPGVPTQQPPSGPATGEQPSPAGT